MRLCFGPIMIKLCAYPLGIFRHFCDSINAYLMLYQIKTVHFCRDFTFAYLAIFLNYIEKACVHLTFIPICYWHWRTLKYFREDLNQTCRNCIEELASTQLKGNQWGQWATDVGTIKAAHWALWVHPKVWMWNKLPI